MSTESSPNASRSVFSEGIPGCRLDVFMADGVFRLGDVVGNNSPVADFTAPLALSLAFVPTLVRVPFIGIGSKITTHRNLMP